jgi:hypothetical protein
MRMVRRREERECNDFGNRERVTTTEARDTDKTWGFFVAGQFDPNGRCPCGDPSARW